MTLRNDPGALSGPSALSGLPVGEDARRFLSGPPKRLFVGGSWVPAADGATLPTTDPATGRHLADLAAGGAADVDAAVGAARAALTGDAWRRMLPAARARLLWRVGDLIDVHAQELAELETLDQGKTLATSLRAEVPAAAEQFRYFAGAATKITGTTFRPSIGYAPPGRSVTASTVKEPVGVVAAITPWNSPLLMAAMKLAPALAAGCTVVLKPAEATSLTAVRLVELLEEAGLPPGVLNLVTGTGAQAGAALVEHRGIDKVSFTGSTATGRAIIGAVRGSLARLTLELGGKSPAIVLADADLDLAVPGIARGIFANAGQVCVASSRVYAARPVVDELVERLAAHADGLRLGHGLAAGSDLGPLVSEQHAQRVAGYVRGGLDDGAHVVTTRTDAEGAYHRPTVVVDVPPASRLAREEVFGPVVLAAPFDDLDEVVAVANDTDYGLAASVWTNDLRAAAHVTDAVRSGTVWVNCHSYFSPELVKGGHKQSGWGYENGMAGLEGYLETKTVCTLT